MEWVKVQVAAVDFLGEDLELAARLREGFGRIDWGEDYPLAPQFRMSARETWSKVLSPGGKGLVFIEMRRGEVEKESALVRDIRAFNPRLQVVLLVDADLDYFQVAQNCLVGNLLRKSHFDAAVLRALTVRLLSGDIFGFRPYFPRGYGTGPVIHLFEGRIEVLPAISECFEKFRPHLRKEEESMIRVLLHELLLNAFSYAVKGISPVERDEHHAPAPREVTVREGETLKVTLVDDGEKAGLSVQDCSGNLSMLRVLQKLRRQSRLAGEAVPPGILDETGRGISMVQRFSRFVVNILKGVRTETIFLHYRDADLNRFESVIITEITPSSSL